MKLHKILRTLSFCSVFIALLTGLFVHTDHTAFAAHTRKSAETKQVETSDAIKNATVNLYCRLKAGKKIYSSSGSGVLISERGIILTNAHVAQYFLLAGEKGRVTGRCSVRTGSPARERYTASILYFPPHWVAQNADELGKDKPKGTGKDDFALLYITGTKKGALPERFPALPIDETGITTEQEAVTIAGYPIEKLGFESTQKSLKFVSASSTVTGIHRFTGNQLVDVLTLAPSAVGAPGISGAPIINNSGEVIGIVTSKSVAKENRTLRAITLHYIDQSLRAESALSLRALLSGDLAARAGETIAELPAKTITIISNGLLKKK